VKNPWDWLRRSEWLSALLEKDNQYAGSPVRLKGHQISAWLMANLFTYIFMAAFAITVGTALLSSFVTPASALKFGFFSLGVCAVLSGLKVWGFHRNLKSLADERLEEVRIQLPYSVDLFVLVLDAGSDFSTALESYLSFGPAGALRDEIQLMLQELRAGGTRNEVMERFAARNPIVEIERLFLVISQSERTGISMIDALKGQAELLRTERMQRAAAVAEKIAVDSKIWLFGVALAVMMLMIGPFLLAMVPGLKAAFG
jgi:Flp pilus assembly protein TadB